MLSQRQANPGTDDLSTEATREEKLLAALLATNQELIDVLGIYDESERRGFDETKKTEVVKRSVANVYLDRTVCLNNCLTLIEADYKTASHDTVTKTFCRAFIA
jgi:hypothetical protein